MHYSVLQQSYRLYIIMTIIDNYYNYSFLHFMQIF